MIHHWIASIMREPLDLVEDCGPPPGPPPRHPSARTRALAALRAHDCPYLFFTAHAHSPRTIVETMLAYSPAYVVGVCAWTDTRPAVASALGVRPATPSQF